MIYGEKLRLAMTHSLVANDALEIKLNIIDTSVKKDPGLLFRRECIEKRYACLLQVSFWNAFLA